MLFCFESRVPAPLNVIFAFHQSPAGIALLHAGWCRLQLLKHPTQIHVGAETWTEQMVAGFIPVVVGFRHHVYEPPNRFGEELIHGPFSRFVHIHEFIEANGETVVSDLLEVKWPWQYGGDLMLRRVIAPRITTMFQRRSESLLRLWREGIISEWVAKGGQITRC
jgi:ligand-binding SRPBCC domain-containing protein